MSQLVSFTTVDGDAINITSTAIELVVDNTTERKLYYDLGGVTAKQADVTEDLATIIADAQDVITLTTQGLSVLFSVPRIISVEADGTGSKVFYDGKGIDADIHIVDENPAAIDQLVVDL